MNCSLETLTHYVSRLVVSPRPGLYLCAYTRMVCVCRFCLRHIWILQLEWRDITRRRCHPLVCYRFTRDGQPVGIETRRALLQHATHYITCCPTCPFSVNEQIKHLTVYILSYCTFQFYRQCVLVVGLYAWTQFICCDYCSTFVETRVNPILHLSYSNLFD